MAVSLHLYSPVRIRQLLKCPEDYDDWRLNRRAPQIGDTGTIVEILHAAGLPDHYVVESVAPDGVTIFLGEFVEQELVAEDPSPDPQRKRYGQHGS